MAESVVRITVNLAPEVARALDALASKMGSTKTQAINQAIVTTAALYAAQDDGAKPVIKLGGAERRIALPKLQA